MSDKAFGQRTIAVICGILLILALLCLNGARLSLWKQGFPGGAAETVSVGQQGMYYLLHFISCDEAAMNGMEPYTWLQEAGCVPLT